MPHFLQVYWFQTKIFVGPKANKFTKEPVAIQPEKKTGCDEYVEDQLNMANKILAKY